MSTDTTTICEQHEFYLSVKRLRPFLEFDEILVGKGTLSGAFLY